MYDSLFFALLPLQNSTIFTNSQFEHKWRKDSAFFNTKY